MFEALIYSAIWVVIGLIVAIHMLMGYLSACWVIVTADYAHPTVSPRIRKGPLYFLVRPFIYDGDAFEYIFSLLGAVYLAIMCGGLATVVVPILLRFAEWDAAKKAIKGIFEDI